MSSRTSLKDRFSQLRWKLTLSYTAVTVGALLFVELVLYIVTIGVFAYLVNIGYVQTLIIESVAPTYSQELRRYLSETPHDLQGIASWLESIRPAPYTVGIKFEETDGLLVVGSGGQLLAISPLNYLENVTLGQPFDPQALPGLANPLQAALAGEKDTKRLYSPVNADNNVVVVAPVWDESGQGVLGALVMSAAAPTVNSVLGDLIPTLGISLLLFTLVSGLIGTAFGFLAARGLVQRLNRLVEATQAWSDGDFAEYVHDPAEDELGQLAQHLNRMAQQLQTLLDTRQELAVVEERNRLARDLHDSAKQQAFAAAAQISAARTLLKQDPQAAQIHIEEAERLTYDLRQELTSLIQELRPAALQGNGLASALRKFAADWSRQNDIEQVVRVQQERPLPLDIEQTIFRIVQEALANIARHSQASTVELELVYSNSDLTCTISDDGRGFNPDVTHTGFGLNSMRARAIALGGTLAIESSAKMGTRLTCVVPLGEFGENKEEQLHE